jgi:nucleoside-diphosphate-sugar epimerase
LDALFCDAEAIFHFAAQLPLGGEASRQTQSIFDANVRAVLNIAEWCHLREVPMVFVSGSTVYQDPHAQNIKENAPKVVSGFGGFYGYSKWLAEEVVSHFVAEGLKAVIIRPSSIYGLGLSSDKLIAHYLDQAITGGVIEVNTPRNKINLVHCLDVANACWLAYQKQAWGVYNVAGPGNYAIEEIAHAATEVSGNGAVKTCDSDGSSVAFVRFDLNISRAREAFGYEPQVTLHRGMSLMANQQLL